MIFEKDMKEYMRITIKNKQKYKKIKERKSSLILFYVLLVSHYM